MLLSRFRSPVLGLLILISLSGCGAAGGEDAARLAAGTDTAPTEEGAYFVNVVEHSGIDYVHSMGDVDLDNIVETVGSGAAFLDYDQDGFMDLYVASSAYTEGVSSGERHEEATGSRLYRNVEGRGFVDVTERSGIRISDGYGMGVAAADFDNDGYPDLYVCNYGANRLYHNDGDGTFTEIAERAGVAGEANTVGAVWLDYDNDGDLDLYVGNYLEYDPEYTYHYAPDGMAPPMAYAGQPDVLYRNDSEPGSSGTSVSFTDVTKEMGLYRPEGRMMGVAAADYDDDGYIDIYVANDAMANYLYRNEGGNGFSDLSYSSGVAFSEGGEETSSMAVDFIDYDGDRDIDLFVADIHFSALYRNEGGGLFRDVTVPSGIAQPSGQYDAWGASFFDYDHDGDPDIFKVNGAMNHLYGHEDQVLENLGDGTFSDVSLELGSYFREEHVGRGMALGDIDNDGDEDVFIINMNERPVLLRNEGLSGNNYLTIQLVGTESNRDGIGARVAVTANGRTQVMPKESASGYLSTNDPRLFFGLGDAQAAERIEIRWPSGRTQVLEDVSANQILKVEEGADASTLVSARS